MSDSSICKLHLLQLSENLVAVAISVHNHSIYLHHPMQILDVCQTCLVDKTLETLLLLHVDIRKKMISYEFMIFYNLINTNTIVDLSITSDPFNVKQLFQNVLNLIYFFVIIIVFIFLIPHLNK